MYSKDINAVTQRNINLPDPVGNFTGVDDRPRWNSGKLNKDVSSMMVLTNTNKGHQASLTVQLTKQFSNGLSGMIASLPIRAVSPCRPGDPAPRWAA